MTDRVRVSVVYYSATGTVAELARTLADEAEKAGADVRLRKVAELAPDTAIDANPAWRANLNATSDNVSAQLKQFIDSLGGLWQQGQLRNKVYSGSMARATQYRGQEPTPGYTDPAKFADGNPYGTSHVSGQGEYPVDDTARTAAAIQARRVVTMTGALRDGLAMSAS